MCLNGWAEGIDNAIRGALSLPGWGMLTLSSAEIIVPSASKRPAECICENATGCSRGMDSKTIMAKILVTEKCPAETTTAVRCYSSTDDPQHGEMMTDEPVSLTIKADINEIPRLSDMLEEVMQEYGFPDEDILDTQLAVEEVVTNVIMHGYGDAGGEILVSCQPGADAVVIQVKDHAEPFDPLSLPEPDIGADIEDRKIGGLGIFLTRQVMDDITYRYENKKNILTLTKKRSGSG